MVHDRVDGTGKEEQRCTIDRARSGEGHIDG